MSLRRSPGGVREDDSNPLHDATWLYSYADLMTQLLIFAILMLAVIGVKPGLEEERRRRTELQATIDAVERFVTERGLAGIAVDRASDRIVIRMPSAILFAEGQAALTLDAERVLGELTPVLARGPSLLRVEGHTDDVPVRGGAFPSNWELSTARALSVVEYLEAHGVARERLSVAGYGEFHPLAPNETGAQRAQNRRVEIVVLGG